MTLSYLSLSASIVLGVAGQLLLKSGAMKDTLRAQILAPQTILGLGIYFLAAVLYIFALRKIPVSIAFPSVSVSYVIVAILAHLLYSEPLSFHVIGGIIFIIIGVILISS